MLVVLGTVCKNNPVQRAGEVKVKDTQTMKNLKKIVTSRNSLPRLKAAESLAAAFAAGSFKPASERLVALARISNAIFFSPISLYVRPRLR